MKLAILHKDQHKLALRVTGISPAYINTLRRIMNSQVPTMAIDHVEFKANNSILFDEMIGHRLGLIPLKTDLKNYNLPKTAWNEPTGDPRLEVQLVLKVPKVKQETVVRAKDLECADKNISPVHANIPIVKLLEGQDLELVATARLGKGEQHVKWSPAHVWYRHAPEITIKKQPKDPQAVANMFPKVFEVKSGKLFVKNDATYNMPDIDIDVEGIEVKFTDNDYILIIESWGQLDPSEIIEQALEIYDEQLDEFVKLSKEIK